MLPNNSILLYKNCRIHIFDLRETQISQMIKPNAKGYSNTVLNTINTVLDK